MKWLWRFSQELQAYWGGIIKAKYGEDDKWISKEVLSSCRTNIWRSIRTLQPLARDHTTIRVFNGWITSFWEDKWLGSSCLKQHFLGIYALNLQQEKPVDEAWSSQDWNFLLRRNRNVMTFQIISVLMTLYPRLELPYSDLRSFITC